MAYTIHLIALECLKAEELHGDEVFIKCNGVKVWEAHPDRMRAVIEDNNFVDHFDFVGGRKHNREGWHALDPFDPETFTISVESGGVALQLWEADTLTSDDFFGQTPVDETQASGGNISVVFQRLGANYRLTYRVEA